MSPALRAQFRLDLLRLIAEAGTPGLRVESCHAELRAAGYAHVSLDETRDAITYLADPSCALLAKVPGLGGPSSDRWRCTKAGHDALETEGGLEH